MIRDLKVSLEKEIKAKTLTSKLDLIHYSYGYLSHSNTSFRKAFKVIDDLYKKYDLPRV